MIVKNILPLVNYQIYFTIKNNQAASILLSEQNE